MTRWRGHPIAMTTRFRSAMVLTFAVPSRVLQALVPPSLTVETVGDLGLVAVALVDMASLRPQRLPAWTGSDAVFVGYRVVVRARLEDGRTRRGLKVLRTDVDRLHLLVGTRLLTRYGTGLVSARWDRRETADRVRVRSRWQGAPLDVSTQEDDPAAPPPGSPFATWDDAAPYSGPLPWTLAPDRGGRTVVAVKGVRSAWQPRPITVQTHEVGFLRQPPFDGVAPVLASAFVVRDVDYAWRPGQQQAVTPTREDHP